MKSVMPLSIVFASLFVALPSMVFGQTYCPQALMGHMNGSWYYNCQTCTNGCPLVHVATDQAYDCGGCCSTCGCGTACVEPISASKGAASDGTQEAPQQADAKNARDNGENKFDVVCIRCKQTNFADFSSFKGPGSHVTIKRYKVLVDFPDGVTYYFFCIEAVHDQYPNMPMRIGQQLDGDTPIPAGMNVKTVTMSLAKAAHRYHRLKVSDSVHFDVMSVNDLGTTP